MAAPDGTFRTLTCTVGGDDGNVITISAGGASVFTVDADGVLTTTSVSATSQGAVTYTGNLTLNNGVNIVLGTSTGTKIGTAQTQKLGFFNQTPVVCQSFIADPTGGATTDAESRAAIASILDLLIAYGLMKAS